MKLPEERKTEWVTREEAETDWNFGERPENKSTKNKIQNGIFLADKPEGPTSHQVSAWVKKILNVEKAGHTGTLDPNATGLLPIALASGTKIAQALKSSSKEYIGLMELEKNVSKRKVNNIATEFVGNNKQTPPELSAVKREERDRKIFYLDILEVKKNKVLFKVGCESGFYVRVLCQDLGKALNTNGELISLRRSKVGSFSEDETFYLQDLLDEYRFWQQGEENKLNEIILPIEAGVRDLKKVMIKDNAVSSLCHGANLGVNGVAKLQKNIEKGELIAILTLKGELVALGKAKRMSSQIVENDGVTAAELERVFMEPGTYPKKWSD